MNIASASFDSTLDPSQPEDSDAAPAAGVLGRRFQEVLDNLALLEELLKDAYLPDVMTFSQVCVKFRKVAKQFYMHRVNTLVMTFIMPPGKGSEATAKFLRDFWVKVDETKSGVFASAIQYMLRRVADGDWFPNNFNLAVPCGRLIDWDTYFHEIGVRSFSELKVDPDVAGNISGIYEYVLNGKYRVTVSVTTGPSVLQAAIVAPHTANIRLLTKNFLNIYDVKLASEGRSMDAWIYPTIRASQNLHKRRNRKSIDNSSWRAACGWNCPVLWRHVSRDTGVLRFCVGEDDKASLDLTYTTTKLKWRLGDTCHNSTCPNYGGNYYPHVAVRTLFFASPHTAYALMK
ncbi:hypothetical protein B0H13DRAFT_2381001 [Mycena leptocephala]|nr:hypothetical protein B0H13DRAFT_2381001 [Mycena leptocephala]